MVGRIQSARADWRAEAYEKPPCPRNPALRRVSEGQNATRVPKCLLHGTLRSQAESAPISQYLPSPAEYYSALNRSPLNLLFLEVQRTTIDGAAEDGMVRPRVSGDAVGDDQHR